MHIHSWDTAIKAASSNDASACLIFKQKDQQHRIVHCWYGRVEYPALKRQVMHLASAYPPDAVLIEDKASGQSLLQDLRIETCLPLIAIQPKGDKLTRVARITPMIEAGQVALPSRAPWLADFEAELLAFPHGAHDDQVDALSQYLNWIREREALHLRIRGL